MIIYEISHATVSSGLRRTYNKQLEVYECEAEITGKLHSEQPIYKIVSLNAVYAWKKKSWERTTKGPACTRGKKAIGTYFRETQLSTSASSKATVFTSLEAAQAAKLLSIQELAQRYKRELQALKELFERNVPNIEKPLNQLLEEHPDVFF